MAKAINPRNVCKDTKELNELVRCLLNMALKEITDNKVTPLVVETYRPKERQYYLYGQGRTQMQCVNAGMPATKAAKYSTPGLPRITWTLNSIHIQRKAVDVIPVRDGKAIWNSQDKETKKIIKIMQRYGFEAGANWTSSPDSPHFQIKGEFGKVFDAKHNTSYITKAIQRQLHEHGFYDGTVDGDWGKLTTQAVNRFRKVYGWKQNGKVGDATLKKLFA